MDITPLKDAVDKQRAAARELVAAGEKFLSDVASLESRVESLVRKHDELSLTESRLEAARSDLQTVQSQLAEARAAYDAFKSQFVR